MKPSLFVDTNGLYALLVPEDPEHARAVSTLQRLQRAGGRAITTDYILDESATLLMSRNKHHVAVRMFQFMEDSEACEVIPVWPDHFVEASEMFQRHGDKRYSFTDCASFVVMKAYDLHDALTSDPHFRIAGFHPLLG